VYIRNDGYSLAVGQTLRVDVVSPSQNSLYSDFGIALMETASPSSVTWSSGTADGRNGLLDLYIKGQFGTIGYRASNSANTQLYSSAGVSITGGISALTGLWITRSSSTEFDVGYSTASGDTQILAMTGLDASMGTGLGFYSDVRANTTYGYLDNLRLVAVPEPSTMAVCGLGAFGLLLAVRRKK
ncbi:MAG TPA: PEP-CTERM sorting domain-containing protein, partial [Candidatus Binatia bacterium]|nr:PEP-CTERM sorting domain-containing protein [Candidatus Binatia bacterium]